jgi:ribosome maturation factor RimP
MTVLDQLADAITPVLADLGLALYDLERPHDALRVTVHGLDGQPVDSERLTRATRAISNLLDTLDPIPGRYTLEVSTPGLERALRTPEHFAGAVGEQVRVKSKPGTDGERRAEGELLGIDDHSITLATSDGERSIAFTDIERARTVVDWSAPPKPGKARANAATSDRRKAST